MTDLIVLSLMLDGPRYGYDLKKDAGVILERVTLHNNLVYPLLAKFLERGWVRRKKVPGERGQTRRLYTLTRSGKAEVLRRLRAFSEKDAVDGSAFQLRVALFSELGARARREIIAARENALKRKKTRLAGISKHFEMGKYGRSVVSLRRKFVETELAWIRGVRRLGRRHNRRAYGKRG